MKYDPDLNEPDFESDEATEAGTTVDSDLQAELAAEKERYQRLAADFDNFRKRTNRDSEQRAAAQKDAFIRELLPIVDNLERALASATPSAANQIRRGVEMTGQQLQELLKRHGVEPDETVGQPFDPHRHEAISARSDPKQADQVVLEEVQRGYRRGDELIRPARVIINDRRRPREDGHGS